MILMLGFPSFFQGGVGVVFNKILTFSAGPNLSYLKIYFRKYSIE